MAADPMPFTTDPGAPAFRGGPFGGDVLGA